MVDFSVLGDVTISSNAGEVGERIENGIDGAARSFEKAAETAGNAEGATEDLAKAFAGTFGSAENMEESLRGVEDELEDVRNDSAGAAGAIYGLQSSMATLNGTTVDLNTDVADLDEQYQIIRNSLGDFDNRVDDVIPDRDTLFADESQFRNSMNLLEGYEKRLGSVGDAADDVDITDPFEARRRSVQPALIQNDQFRESLVNALSYESDINPDRGQRQAPGVVSRLFRSVEGDLNIESLARKLANADAVASDFSESLEAVEEALDLDRGNLPVPFKSDEERGITYTPAEFGSEVSEAVRRSRPAGGMDVNEVIEVDPRSGGLGVLEDVFGPFDDIDFSELDDNLDGVNSELAEFERKFDTSAIGSIARADTERGETIGQEIGPDLRSRRVPGGLEAIGGATGATVGSVAMSSAANKAENEIKDVRTALSELQVASVQTTSTLGFVVAGLNTLTTSSVGASQAVENLDDEVEDLARSLSALVPALKTVSANLGPFNIGFANLLITIPALIAFVGPLITLFLGLASAAVAVAGAFGALVAVGAMGFLQNLEDQFAGINNTMEAVEATAQGFKEAIIDAVAPLQDVTIGGLGASGIFVTVLRDIVELVHMFAEAAAELLEMEEVQSFLLELRAAVLGFSDRTGGLTMIEGLTVLIENALPLLEDFFVWFIDKLPDAMAYWGKIIGNLGPTVSDFGSALLELVTVITRVGAGIGEQLLPPLAFTINVFASVISVALEVYEAFGMLSDVTATAVIAFLAITMTLMKMIAVAEFAFKINYLVAQSLEHLTDAVEDADNAYDAFTQTLQKGNQNMVMALKSTIMFAGGVLLLVAGIALVLESLGLLAPLLETIGSFFETIGSVIGTVNGHLNEMGLVGDIVQSVIEFIAGTILIAAGATLILNSQIVAGIGNMIAYAGSTSIATSSVGAFTASIWSAVTAVISLNAALLTGALVGIALIAKGLYEIHNLVGPVATGITALAAAFGAATVAVTALILGLGALKVALISTGVGAVIVGIGLALAYLYKNWDKVKSALDAGLGLNPIILQFRLLKQVMMSIWDIVNGLDGSSISIDLFGNIISNLLPNFDRVTGQDITNEQAAASNRTTNTSRRSETNVEVNVDNSGSGSIDDRMANKFGRIIRDKVLENERRENGR